MWSMNSETTIGRALEAARREIDSIDDQLLELLGQRFAATEKVRHAKREDSEAAPLPFRPAREAQILRRLLARAGGLGVPGELLVRLWRGILSQSSLNQAPITIHVSRRLNANLGHRLRLRDHFGPMPVEEYRDEAQALVQINAQPGDICVVETEQNWAEAFVEGCAGAAGVIAGLPVLAAENPMPALLVLGHAPMISSGDDETLVITKGKLPRDFAPEPLWQGKSGGLRLSALPGFLAEHESPLIGLVRSNAALGLQLAGHYSRAISI
jgi:chorismate mutase/prephenate dehydratase